MAIHLSIHSRSLDDLVRFDRNVFATKIRMVRAVLGWSQTELGLQVGLTQRAIHKLEQGENTATALNGAGARRRRLAQAKYRIRRFSRRQPPCKHSRFSA